MFGATLLGRIRTSIFPLAKTNCHRKYGKLFAFTFSNEKKHLYVNTSFINASKPVKTCRVFHADIVKLCKTVFSKDISLHEQI